MNEGGTKEYSTVALLFHWFTVPLVLILFGLGLWMDSLSYYHAWYQRAPELHIAFGLALTFLVLCRLTYRWASRYPGGLSTHTLLERRLARGVHVLLYLLMLSMFVTGYLIITAEGEPLSVFGWFELPSLVSSKGNLQDVAGEIHEYLAYTLIGLIILHALAALKHHFIDGDETLRRMLGQRARPQ